MHVLNDLSKYSEITSYRRKLSEWKLSQLGLFSRKSQLLLLGAIRVKKRKWQFSYPRSEN